MNNNKKNRNNNKNNVNKNFKKYNNIKTDSSYNTEYSYDFIPNLNVWTNIDDQRQVVKKLENIEKKKNKN